MAKSTFTPSEPQLYAVAKTAYSKLVDEAAHKDQNLRRLVGHANLYDKLLDEYNNSFSDSDSDSEPESYDEDAEEFASLSYTTPKSYTTIAAGKDEVKIVGEEHIDTEHGIKFGEIMLNEKDDVLALCQVPSHEGDLRIQEVQVGETEIFDDD